MCGIVGYVGPREALPLLMGGLRRLEYRGYDSAGVAVQQNGTLQILRAEGKLDNLAAIVTTHPTAGHTGIGHTRWATHGRPTKPRLPCFLGSRARPRSRSSRRRTPGRSWPRGSPTPGES